MSPKPWSIQPVELFFSYAHKDEELREGLETHLKILQRQNVIKCWHDRQIIPGSDFAGQIDEHLESAGIILLLISADFLASDYCYEREMRRALERNRNEEACVIPIILRPCKWRATEFGRLQALPKDGKPVVEWPIRDAAFHDITDGIHRRIMEQNERPPESIPPSPIIIPAPQITAKQRAGALIIFTGVCVVGMTSYLWPRLEESGPPPPPVMPDRPPIAVPAHDEAVCAKAVNDAMNAPAFETNLKYGSISVTNDTHRTIRVLRYIHSCFDKRVKSSDPEAEELTMLSDPRVITVRPGDRGDYQKVLPSYSFLMLQDANDPQSRFVSDRRWNRVEPGKSYDVRITDEIFQNQNDPDRFKGIEFKPAS